MTIQLMAHQAEAVRIASERDRFCYWLDCGTGKTIAMLAAINTGIEAEDLIETFGEGASVAAAALKVQGGKTVRLRSPVPYKKTLVVCPKSIMRNAWARDAEHFPRIRLVVCWATTPAKRRALIARDADVYVTNPETFRKHAEDFFAAGVRRLIVDESSKIKNPDSKITRAVTAFARKMESVYMLSGTPAPNNITEYYPQVAACDHTVFPATFGAFCARYAIPIQREIFTRRGMTKVTTGYRPVPHTQDEFQNRLRSVSWSLSKEDAVDLPPQIDVMRRYSLAAPEAAAYTEAEEDCRVQLAGESVPIKQQAIANKLRQICGGWIYREGVAENLGDSKAEAFSELMEELTGRQVVVWADFREDIDRLTERVGDSFSVLDGRSTGDTAAVVADFQAGKTRVLICHPQSVGHGVTMTAASHAIYYGMPWSYEYYKQSRDRIHRTGQRAKCVYYHMVGEGTIEEVVYRSLRGKGRAMDEVMKSLAREIADAVS